MTTERVMLLIDADNVSVDVMEQAVRLLMNQHGAVHVRRAYCTAEGAVKHQAVFKRLSIKPMVNLAAGKNSTDIALAVDAIDLVLAERPDVVVIASSDSDFAPLVARLREKGCVVRGIGQEGKTGDETQDAYDDFTVLAHRKPAGAASASASATGSARRGGARGAAASQKAQKVQGAAKPTGAAAPARPATGETARGQPAGRGGRSQRGERPPQREGKAASDRAALAADDQAEDDAAAEATLATLRAATERAASQQAAAAAQGRATGTPADPPGPTEESAPAPAPAAKKAARKTAARKKAVAQAEPAAEGSAQLQTAPTDASATPKASARKTPARKAPSRKAAAGRAAAASTESPEALPEERPEAPAGAQASDDAVADAEALAAQIAATLAPPVTAPSPRPAPARNAAPQRATSVVPSSAAVAALPDKVLEILASLPELARGDTVELRLASQRMRDAGLLGRSGSSTKLLGQFADRFELLPPGQPNHVRLRGGKLF